MHLSHLSQSENLHYAPILMGKNRKKSLFHGRFEISCQTGLPRQHKQKIWSILITVCKLTCDFLLWIQACRPEYNGSFLYSDTLIWESIWSHQIATMWGLPLLPLMTSTASAFHRQKKELFGLVCVSDIIANKWKLFYHTPYGKDWRLAGTSLAAGEQREWIWQFS